ncbi:MAG TPA: hypothetical protein QGF58_24275 [Myxococcota bacterium]|nr:hypothetical protein [Myxococcota bacterium]
MSPRQLGRGIGVLAVVVLFGSLAAGALLVPVQHGERVDVDQAMALGSGTPAAPEPNFPGGLNGQAVGEKQDANRDLQKQIWREMAEAAKRGEDPLSRGVARETRKKLQRRVGRKSVKPGGKHK